MSSQTLERVEAPPSMRPRLQIADMVFLLAVLALVVARYRILAAGGSASTIDAGNWLAFGDQIFGTGARSSTIVYPPLVPVATTASVWLFGLTAGVALTGAIAAAAPALGLYAVIRRLSSPNTALVPALLLLGASSVGEAAAWGGFPQLIGMGLLLVALERLDRFLRDSTRPHAWHAGIAFALVLATSHFIAAVAVIAGGLLVATALATGIRPFRLGTLVRLLAPSVWLIPVYVALLSAFTEPARDAAAFDPITTSTLFDRIEFLYRDAPWLWRLLLVLAVASPAVFFRFRRTSLWRLTATLLAATAIALIVIGESRFVYLATPIGALGTALWIDHMIHAWRGSALHRRNTAIAMAVLLVAAAWQMSAGLRFFEGQQATYALLSPDLTRGLEQLAAEVPQDATLAVTSLKDAPLGWWVEAITDRATYYGAPLRWLVFPNEIERAAVANEIFVPPFPSDDGMVTAAAAGVDLVLVPTGWVFYDEVAMNAFAATHPGAVNRITPDLVVIDVGAIPPQYAG